MTRTEAARLHVVATMGPTAVVVSTLLRNSGAVLALVETPEHVTGTPLTPVLVTPEQQLAAAKAAAAAVA